MPQPAGVDDDRLVLDRSYDDGTASFRFRADADAMARLDVAGRGSMESSRALIEALDEFLVLAPDMGPTDLLVDLREATGGPVRAQFLFGKWVMRHKRALRRAAIVGANALERRVTVGVTTIGRIKLFRFFKEPESALTWLNEGTPRAQPKP